MLLMDLMNVACLPLLELEGKSYILGLHACMSAQSLSHIWFFVTLWTVACQAPLSMGFSRQPVLIHLHTYCSSQHDVWHQAIGGPSMTLRRSLIISIEMACWSRLCPICNVDTHTHTIGIGWEINGFHSRKKKKDERIGIPRYSYLPSQLYKWVSLPWVKSVMKHLLWNPKDIKNPTQIISFSKQNTSIYKSQIKARNIKDC